MQFLAFLPAKWIDNILVALFELLPVFVFALLSTFVDKFCCFEQLFTPRQNAQNARETTTTMINRGV